MSAATLTDVDTSGLDLLDDDQRHVMCNRCQEDAPGVPFDALCGRRAIAWHVKEIVVTLPANTCHECAALLDKACRRCGQ